MSGDENKKDHSEEQAQEAFAGDDVELIDDAEGQAPEVRNQVERLRQRLKKCRSEKQEYLEGWQRAKADLINARKENEKRMQETHQRAGKGIAADLLDVVDNLDRALANRPEEASEWGRGIEQIRRQMMGALERHGVKPIAVDEGDRFDPEYHEAVEREASEQSEDTIVSVRRAGYTINDHVLRPAQVVVAAATNENS